MTYQRISRVCENISQTCAIIGVLVLVLSLFSIPFFDPTDIINFDGTVIGLMILANVLMWMLGIIGHAIHMIWTAE